jgi:hypothetical protein
MLNMRTCENEAFATNHPTITNHLNFKKYFLYCREYFRRIKKALAPEKTGQEHNSCGTTRIAK